MLFQSELEDAKVKDRLDRCFARIYKEQGVRFFFFFYIFNLSPNGLLTYFLLFLKAAHHLGSCFVVGIFLCVENLVEHRIRRDTEGDTLVCLCRVAALTCQASIHSPRRDPELLDEQLCLQLYLPDRKEPSAS